MTTATCRVTGIGLTACEQRMFMAIVIDCTPLDALAARLGVRLF